jgi:hypothetical protein
MTPPIYMGGVINVNFAGGSSGARVPPYIPL